MRSGSELSWAYNAGRSSQLSSPVVVTALGAGLSFTLSFILSARHNKRRIALSRNVCTDACSITAHRGGALSSCTSFYHAAV